MNCLLIELTVRILVIGIGATFIMDVWNFFLAQFGIKSLNFGYLGRWIGNIPKGILVHKSIKDAKPIAGELFIGYFAHYSIGILFATVLVFVYGLGWTSSPTVRPALITGIVTVVAPYFILQPALGLGLASSKTPFPLRSRIKSFASHVVFGLGLYLSALVYSWLI